MIADLSVYASQIQTIVPELATAALLITGVVAWLSATAVRGRRKVQFGALNSIPESQR